MDAKQIMPLLDRWTAASSMRRENCRDCGNGFDLPVKSRRVRCPECLREREQRIGHPRARKARPLRKLTVAGVAVPGRKQPGRR